MLASHRHPYLRSLHIPSSHANVLTSRISSEQLLIQRLRPRRHFIAETSYSTTARTQDPRLGASLQGLTTTRNMASSASKSWSYQAAEHHVAGQPRATNRLIHAKSPYLLQHAENPVDWYEWGTEAFEKARRENKPIFLSVGYSACHWCHVLAHESFEDPVTAKFMNDYYVNIKVDREERPDVDRLYMAFLQATTGGGGWPMSVWLTPDLHPFFAGTYFPPGQFRSVLAKLVEIWEDDSERCITSGKQVIERLQEASNIAASDATILPIRKLAASVYSRLAKRFDNVHGGFGGAPKFPQPSQTMWFLSRWTALSLHSGDPGASTSQEQVPSGARSITEKSAEEILAPLDAETSQAVNAWDDERDAGKVKQAAEKAKDMAAYTLEKIYQGGIHDHVGGGVARYSVDERWHVPHFEKMLYDQAQLLTSSVELALLYSYDSSHRSTLLALARSILTYIPRHLTAPSGGFYSAEDADSLPSFNSTKTREGAFYTWTAGELDEVLGVENATIFGHAYGVKTGGNCDPRHDIHGELEGQNVLYLAHTPEETAKHFGRETNDVRALLLECLDKLRAHRDATRPRPHLDDKILASWNGLMITGLAKAAEVLEGEEAQTALQLAEQSAAFIRENLFAEASGELRRSWREGPGPQGQTDDYAFLIQGLLDLYEASGKEEYVTWAIRLQEKQDELFFDEEDGGYFASAPDEHILVRMKDAQDGAEPSAVSVTLSNLQRLAHFAENRHQEYQHKAESILASNAQLLKQAPFALATMVGGAMLAHKGYKQFILTEHPAASLLSPFLSSIRERFMPNRVLIHLDPTNPPRQLGEVNATLASLIAELDAENTKGVDLASVKPDVRICENFTCGLPIQDVEELKRHL